MIQQFPKLVCTKPVTVADGYDNCGRRWVHHEPCGRPATEVEIKGLLTSAKAILCEQHRQAAERETFTSKKGYSLSRMPIKPKKSDSLVLPFRK